MQTACTTCGCEWDSDGFYHTADGAAIQPCKICRCDTASIYYLNHAEDIRTKRRQSYHADKERKREYYRNYRREQRAQAS